MSGSCAYSCIDPAQNERFGIYGVSERNECDDYISEMGKYEIRIPKPRILVQGILCGYCRIFLWTILLYCYYAEYIGHFGLRQNLAHSNGNKNRLITAQYYTKIYLNKSALISLRKNFVHKDRCCIRNIKRCSIANHRNFNRFIANVQQKLT